MCNFFLSVSFIVSEKVRIFPLNMHDIIIYLVRWWEKHLSKCCPLKHACSWCCIINTEKTSKNISTYREIHVWRKNCLQNWWIQNPKIKYFRQQHTSPFIQRRLDYFFVSNLQQESVNKTDVLADFSTGHSLLLFSLDLCKDENRVKGLWKFNNFLSMNSDSVTEMKYHTKSNLQTLKKVDITDC